MKKILPVLLLIVLAATKVGAQYPDLPGGGGNYDLQTLPTGSYVIAMDNKNQGDGTSTFTVVVNNRPCSWTSGGFRRHDSPENRRTNDRYSGLRRALEGARMVR